MKQSALRKKRGAGLHVAVIMDGNGRWATARGRARSAGHLAGARAARRTVEAAVRAGVDTLTLYAFSGDNWRRPPAEVAALLRLFRHYLAIETARCVAHGVRLAVIGRRDRLPDALRAAVERAERATAAGGGMRLRIAIDYSARDAILRAAALAAHAPAAVDAPGADANADADADLDAPAMRARFAALLGAALHDAGPSRDVDLLIRTGGEQRLSDFLLWECAYAELWFTPTLWPDFGPLELARALADFGGRERRFGALPAPGARAASPTTPTSAR